jgi:hypothetical protein
VICFRTSNKTVQRDQGDQIRAQPGFLDIGYFSGHWGEGHGTGSACAPLHVQRPYWEWVWEGIASFTHARGFVGITTEKVFNLQVQTPAFRFGMHGPAKAENCLSKHAPLWVKLCISNHNYRRQPPCF